MSNLRSIEEIPEPYREIFKEHPYFNHVQSIVLDDILYSSAPIVVTAPTGSGKTALFELSIVKQLLEVSNFRKFKAVYVAPVKALCNERFSDWNARFRPLGLSCIEVTGDSLDDPDVDGHQIIISTPEKWDSLTRRWRDKVSWVLMVKLLMIDEIHLIRDPKRGPILESIVCRMKTMMRVLKMEGSIRFVAVSATIFNIEDLAGWLGTSDEPAKFHRFGNEARPVKLKWIVKGYPQRMGQSAFLYDIQLSYKLKPLLMEHAHGKPVLIFCSTRKGVVQTSKVLSEQLSFRFNPEDRMILLQAISQMVDNKLRDSVLSGIAYHHAGMVSSDRNLVQDLFMQGSLPVLIATSTMAMGVNLPAHLVIIKSTHQYIAGRVEEYDASSVLQMVGRAGRPQFDTSATAIIMTKPSMVGHYESLLDCKEVLESNLHSHLAEHLNSEIVLLTIGDLGVAMEWLRCTFLYQRALKNPQYYGLGSSSSASKIEKALETIVLKEINALKRDGLVEMNENGMDIMPTANGRLMSHFYVNFSTFRLFSDVKPNATIKDLLCLLSDSNEVVEMQLRVSERRVLNELNSGKHREVIRFPMKGKINTRALKVNCLVQACLGCLTIPDPSLSQEALRAINNLARIVKCLVQYLHRKQWFIAYLSAVILAKCLHARLWENSKHITRQLGKIGPALSSALVEGGKTSFDSLERSHPQELERILNRVAPFGNSVIDQVRHLPRYSLLVEQTQKLPSSSLSVKVAIKNSLLVEEFNTTGPCHSVTIIVGDTNNKLLHSRQVADSILLKNNLEFHVSLVLPLPQRVFVRVISNQWVGLDMSHALILNPLVRASVDNNSYLSTKLEDTQENCSFFDVLPEAPKMKHPPVRASVDNNSYLSTKLEDTQENCSFFDVLPEAPKMKHPPKKTFKNEKPKIIFESFISEPPPLTPLSYQKVMEENKHCSFDVYPDFLEEVPQVGDVAAVEKLGTSVKEVSTYPENSSNRNPLPQGERGEINAINTPNAINLALIEKNIVYSFDDSQIREAAQCEDSINYSALETPLQDGSVIDALPSPQRISQPDFTVSTWNKNVKSVNRHTDNKFQSATENLMPLTGGGPQSEILIDSSKHIGSPEIRKSVNFATSPSWVVSVFHNRMSPKGHQDFPMDVDPAGDTIYKRTLCVGNLPLSPLFPETPSGALNSLNHCQDLRAVQRNSNEFQNIIVEEGSNLLNRDVVYSASNIHDLEANILNPDCLLPLNYEEDQFEGLTKISNETSFDPQFSWKWFPDLPQNNFPFSPFNIAPIDYFNSSSLNEPSSKLPINSCHNSEKSASSTPEDPTCGRKISTYFQPSHELPCGENQIRQNYINNNVQDLYVPLPCGQAEEHREENKVFTSMKQILEIAQRAKSEAQ